MIDGLLTLAAGVYVSLFGFGIVSASKDRKKSEEWLKKRGWFLKIAGPLIAAWGAYTLIKAW